MIDVMLATAGALGLAVAATYAALQRWSASPPLLALLVGVILGPALSGVITIPASDHAHVVHTASRLLLAVALMAVALRYPIGDVRRRGREVGLLLVVVMPAMAAAVAAAAGWILGLPLGVALVLGAVLSPTDPVLASGVVTGAHALRDIAERDRQILSLESGANDGLALPFVVVAVSVATASGTAGATGRAVYQTLAGVAVGAAIGFLAGKAMRWAEEHREIESAARSLFTLVLAALVLGVGGLLRADGLLGVFVAGLVYSAIVSASDRRVEARIDETMNIFLVLPVFILFGAVLPWERWAELGWPAVAFVLAALLLRRLPWVLALRAPLGLSLTSAAWLGWFGPIGVAALFYLGHAQAHGVTDSRLWAAGTLVVAASTAVHGLTAAAGRIAYARASGGG